MEVGDKIRRKPTKKKTRPNTHPIYTIKRIFHSQGHNIYVLVDEQGGEFSMVEEGVLKFHEKIKPTKKETQ